MPVKLYPSSEVKEMYRKAIRYLVKHRLVGNLYVLDSLWDYFVENESPSTIGYRYGISKYRVRGFAQRICEHVGRHNAKKVVKLAVPLIRKVNPILIKSGLSYLCLKCGEVIYGSPIIHLNSKHSHEVEVIVRDVCEETGLC